MSCSVLKSTSAKLLGIHQLHYTLSNTAHILYFLRNLIKDSAPSFRFKTLERHWNKWNLVVIQMTGLVRKLALVVYVPEHSLCRNIQLHGAPSFVCLRSNHCFNIWACTGSYREFKKKHEDQESIILPSNIFMD